uniref:Golgi apparatus membrane protein tvp38 n=1 Tax=Anopheles maculatus TaxID=74869 RepID=A0A182T5M2_9DIPT
MSLLDENGIEFDEQAVSFLQAAKTAEDYCQRQGLPSPTFVLSNTPTTTTTTTVPTFWESFNKTSRYISTPKRCAALQFSQHRTSSTFSDPALAAETTNGFKAPPPLTLPSEAFYTVVTLEGTTSSNTTVPRSYLIDFDSVAKQTANSVHPSVFDRQRFKNGPLFEETPAAAVLSRPSSLPVTKGAVASERKRTIPADPIAMRDNLLYRLQRIVITQRKLMFNLLFPLCLLIGIMLLIYAFRDTAKGVLFWIETQNTWIIFVIFLGMFIIVSFPVTVGYLVLIIASGYLFGFIRGLLTVMIGANLGVAIAHNTIKSLQSKLPVHK